MAPGPADGPVLEWISLLPPDPDRVAALLLALGFTGDRHFPRRAFTERDGVSITLLPLGEPEHADEATWTSFETDVVEQPASIVLATPHGEAATLVLDQVEVSTTARTGAGSPRRRCCPRWTRRSRGCAATSPTGRTRAPTGVRPRRRSTPA